MTRIALIGPSEAGLRLGVTLQTAGAHVLGYELAPSDYLPIPLAESVESAVVDADIVLVFVAPHLAEKTAWQIAPMLKAGALYADCGTGTPELKKRLAQVFAQDTFADAALTSADSLDAAGTSAQALADSLSALGVKVTVVSEVPGDVAARSLIRTLLANGLAEVLADTLWAAESLGIEAWAWNDIKDECTSLSADTVQALINDTAHNFKRNQIAMQDVIELLTTSGYDSTMIAPIQFTHGRIMHGKKIPFSQPQKKK